VQIPPVVPGNLARNVVSVWGEDGRAWLAGLPGLVDEVFRLWHLDQDGAAPFAMSFHWVVPVTRSDGSPAVLKIGLPGAEHLAVEAAALRAFGGRGAVRLLGYDAGRGALLLERAEPGTPAKALVPHDDAAALAALLAVGRELHTAPVPASAGLRSAGSAATGATREGDAAEAPGPARAERAPSGSAPVPVDGDLPDLSLLARSFDRYLRTYPGDGPLPRRLVDTAARLFTELCGSAPARVVLHGDLHHENVLRSGPDGWLAIDPHGWVGDPGYDLGAILYNPDPDVAHPDRLALVPRRLEQMVEAADMPRERVVAWCFVKAVLSDVWNTEGEEFDAAGHPATRAIQVAGLLEPELR
jgi:streptomycin 6-kinase